MTILLITGLIVLFFVVPYLTGNIYGVVFRKKELGIVSTYLSGVAIVYAFLTMLQFAIIKFKLDFYQTTRIYNVMFAVLIVVGIVAFAIRMLKNKTVHMDVFFEKKSIWILGLIIMQGILYIGLKNPYFEDNALLETARVTLKTGTVYEYNAFTGIETKVGFPLSNKLMFLPLLYAYISALSGVDLMLMFNFAMPIVTFISFYLVMLLWVQKLSRDNNFKWEWSMFLLVWIIQVGDCFSHSTAFRILHSGYTGEAIFIGVLFAYALYSIKNKSYLIAFVCMVTFPGLIKYDAVFEFVKRFGEYWKAATLGGGMLLLYILSVTYMLIKDKKVKIEMLNLHLTIMESGRLVWDKLVKEETTMARKWISGVVVLVVLLLCGNIMLVSNATSWRSNVCGVNKMEYELLQKLDQISEGEKNIAACDEVVKWTKRLGLNMTPVVGYDLGGQQVAWYSYEEYDKAHIELWESINHATAYMEQELTDLLTEIDMEYVVVERITDIIPIRNNATIKCIYDGPGYLVYYVDKK